MFLIFLSILVLGGSLIAPTFMSNVGENSAQKKSTVKKGGGILASILFVGGLFTGMFFYAEPGYNYHVKTIWGTEDVVTETGWAVSGYKEPTPWNKALSMVVTNEVDKNGDHKSKKRSC